MIATDLPRFLRRTWSDVPPAVSRDFWLGFLLAVAIMAVFWVGLAAGLWWALS